MKILQLVTKRQYRGAEVFAANLSKELLQLGHSIIFAGLYSNNENILTVEGAENIDLSHDKKSNFSLSLVKSLVHLVKMKDPDVIQCNGSDTLKYMIAASYMIKKKPIVYRNISTISEWLGSDIKLSVYKKIFSKVDHVTSVGSESIQDLIKTLDYPERQTSVIRRGIPNKKIEGLNYSDKLKSELNLEQNDKIVMHVGNFSPEKNHKFLVEIFNDLQKSHPHIKLICVGDGVTFESIKNEVKEKGLDQSIFLLGFRKDIPELLSAADCIVLSSLVEGVPGVILEAAVQEKPAVASNVGGVKEVLLDGTTGFIIDDFEKSTFKSRLVDICANDELRLQLGKNARKLVVEQFNPVKNAKKFETLYAKLAGKRLGRPDGKLRVLQIIQKKQYRGAEIFCCQLASELEKDGHDVRIYSIYDGDADLPFAKPIESLERKQSFRYADYYGWKAIAEIVKEFKPDIIQANASDTLKYTVLSKELFGWDVPIIFRNASVTSYYINGKLSRELNRYLFQKVDRIISVSESSKRDLNTLFPFTKSKTDVITNGVDEQIDKQAINPYKREFVNVVHVGSLTEEKNHKELLMIFKAFLSKKPNSKLHIIGEGNLKDNIDAQIKELKLSESVRLYGEMSNPEPYIHYADMLVLPSLVEGLPGVILEAMNLKTPVIAFDVGGISEILNNQTGYIVRKHDQVGFVSAMNEALTSEAIQKTTNAKDLVGERFSNKVIADSFVTVYEEASAKNLFN